MTKNKSFPKSSLSLQDARIAISQLKTEIAIHDRAYYVNNAPEIPDADYDRQLVLLRAIEEDYPELITSDSPTQRISPNRSPEFKEVKHRIPMLSIRTETDTSSLPIEEFQKRVIEQLGLKAWDDLEVAAEYKFDGLAVELIYQKGIFTKASTRGDGFVGEDVTANVRTIKSIPLRILGSNCPEYLEVRGEVMMPLKAFEEYNKKAKEEGKPPLINPRNAAAGALRQLDPSVTASRSLIFMAYGVGDVSKKFRLPKTQVKLLNWLAELGFPSNKAIPASGVTTVQQLMYFYESTGTIRKILKYDIDGVVYKINRLDYQKKLGIVGREPRWAIAHKFIPEEAMTIVNDITVQVGRTGALTPVARLDPVFVGGTTITNATLSNQDEIDRKDIRIGDTVVIRRAGDVIPEITRSVMSKRPLESKPFKLIEVYPVCPECGSTIEKEEEEAVYRCTGGINCPAQQKQAILHFFSKRAMNVDGIGETLIDDLVDQGLINKAADIFYLDERTLAEKTYLGEKRAKKVLAEIKAIKHVTPARFIYALGIRGCGEGTAKALSAIWKCPRSILQFANIWKRLDGSEEGNVLEQKILKLSDVGPITVARIKAFLFEPSNLKHLTSLIDAGIDCTEEKENYPDILHGLTFAITGSFDGYSRDELKEHILKYHGKTCGKVSRKTDYLIAGEGGGSKLADAYSLSVPVITEIAYFAAINDTLNLGINFQPKSTTLEPK